MNKKNGIYLILIILVIGIYYYQSNSDTPSLVVDNNISEEPTYQSKDMLTVVYDPSGTLMYKIVATQVQYFDQKSETQFTAPNVTLYGTDKTATWTIKANSALLTKQRVLYLKGDVEVNNLSPNAQLERIKTDNADVNLLTQLITSEDEVIIQGPGFYSTGNKLRGNLREKTANLLENVKTYYSSYNSITE